MNETLQNAMPTITGMYAELRQIAEDAKSEYDRLAAGLEFEQVKALYEAGRLEELTERHAAQTRAYNIFIRTRDAAASLQHLLDEEA